MAYTKQKGALPSTDIQKIKCIHYSSFAEGMFQVIVCPMHHPLTFIFLQHSTMTLTTPYRKPEEEYLKSTKHHTEKQGGPCQITWHEPV